MKKAILMAALAAVCVSSTSCATMHAVRWTYEEPSHYDEPSQFGDDNAVRAWVSVPLIVVSSIFDAVTWPEQLIFGVWPMWGDASLHCKPDE
jgi:cobalamin synthase